uniref:hypothetical protein n=1 Tax=Thaumasiovibrio occultus TaxID=1891184 RepID=UPI000B3604E7|nr:hypothetical protein [Thaumasiovibrio occultus]
MVTISGQIVPASQTVRSAQSKKKAARKTAEIGEPTVVATAVSKGIRAGAQATDAAQAHARLQYDAPLGRNREALSRYHDVLHQQRRDELSEMFGVDIYV